MTTLADQLKKHYAPIKFDEKAHRYFLDGKELMGVSTFRDQFVPPFDSDHWSQVKAKELGVEPSVILQQWATSREAGFAKGTTVHEHIKGILDPAPVPDEVTNDPYLQLNQAEAPPPLPEMKAFDRFWEHQNGLMTPIVCELVIGSSALRLGGTLDSLMMGRDGGLTLWDWKTGSKFYSQNKYNRLLSPFAWLDDCELNRYALQLSAYNLLLQEAGVMIGGMYILYLAPTGKYQVHKVPDLSAAIRSHLALNPINL
jgi:hypothetical protein